MAMKYYSMYLHIKQYYTLVANFMSPPNPQQFVTLSTRNAYRIACKQLNAGQATQEQIIARFPLN